MSVARVVTAVVCALLAGAADVSAQDGDRIWGRVETRTGDVVEGFLRWDGNHGSWVDVLQGSKQIPREQYRAWSESVEVDESRRTRTIELMGFRISWEEDDPDFPSTAQSGIRFGHVSELRKDEEGRISLVLRSGGTVGMDDPRGAVDVSAPGFTVVARSAVDLEVEEPGRGVLELEWGDVRRVVFGPVPGTAHASAPRLYGTVRDRWGNLYRGYISWDSDEILASDVLDGSEGGRDREILFGEIAAIERDWDGVVVTMLDGRELELSGSNDVGRGHRGVQISDPELGLVEVEWDEFETIRFHEPDRMSTWADFDGGHRLRGTVRTRGGEEFTGDIIWDADEAWSWEILDGVSRDVQFDIEFGMIDRIERASSRSARVVLLNGRSFELEDSNDVNRENKGIFVRLPEGEQGPEGTREWRMLTWDEFEEVRFHHD